jgi:hypothetical protein
MGGLFIIKKNLKTRFSYISDSFICKAYVEKLPRGACL